MAHNAVVFNVLAPWLV